jgi:hypothetical protein
VEGSHTNRSHARHHGNADASVLRQQRVNTRSTSNCKVLYRITVGCVTCGCLPSPRQQETMNDETITKWSGLSVSPNYNKIAHIQRSAAQQALTSHIESRKRGVKGWCQGIMICVFVLAAVGNHLSLSLPLSEPSRCVCVCSGIFLFVQSFALNKTCVCPRLPSRTTKYPLFVRMQIRDCLKATTCILCVPWVCPLEPVFFVEGALQRPSAKVHC